MSRHSRWVLPFVLAVAVSFVLTACAGTAQPADIAPAGAGQGLNTFILVYSDN